MICCSCGKEIYINYGREYWNGIYCKKCADEMLSTPEDTKKYEKIIADLQSENAELKSSLTHANEECLKWHERAQNLLKDSGGSISGYEKKISDLQSENAALRERLERAVVNGKRFIVEKQIDGREVYVVCRYKVIKSYICTEYTREAAEARLAELNGEKK